MAVLNREEADRMPRSGANSTVTYEQMEKVNAFWPEGHVKVREHLNPWDNAAIGP
jgi:[methyl-Co(III) methanol-specific corrinoid protein]:coenzyme M methyltransferase